MKILGIDPDTRTTGLALLEDGKLVYADVLRCSEFSIPQIVNVLGAAYSASTILEPGMLCVIEDPQIYVGKGASPHADIAKLGQVAAALYAAVILLGISLPQDVCFVKPQEWKGSVPKGIHQARILGRLGIPYTLAGGTSPYAVPDDRMGLKVGDWKHVSDAVGLAEFGKRRVESRPGKRFAQ